MTAPRADWQRYAAWPRPVQIGAWVVAALLVVGFGVVVLAGGSSRSGWLPAGAVRGHFAGDLPAEITADHVYCRWVDGHVEVHVRFTNHDYGELITPSATTRIT